MGRGRKCGGAKTGAYEGAALMRFPQTGGGRLEELMHSESSERPELRSGNLDGAGFFDDFKRGFNTVVGPVAGLAKPFLPLLGPYGAAASAGLGALGYGKAKSKATRKPAGPNDGRRRRAELVKKVMKEYGCSMIDASKVVKDEGLYKPTPK